MTYSSALVTLIVLTGCQVDKDGDGLYAPEDPTAISSAEDCDDSDPSVKNPSTEICDGIDNDCDGDIDEGVTTTFYLDADGDGYGTTEASSADDGTENSVQACYQPIGYVLTNDDCNDANAMIHPNAVEVCDVDEIDDDCDGDINDADAVGQTVWYVDADRDGYGDSDAATSSVEQCYAPEDDSIDYVSNNTDCNDSDSTINEGAAEIAGDDSNEDENCDAYIQCYFDSDGDGYGAGDVVLVPLGTECMNRDDTEYDGTQTYSRTNEDCDDTRSDSYPGAAFEEPGAFCMRDADGDGYGELELSSAESAQGLVAGTDCDDSSSTVFPGATEGVADSIDQNCDGEELCYVDSDGDGYGSTLPPITSTDTDCFGSNEADNQDDCDDNDAFTFPGAAENEVTTSTDDCRKDADEDGYGDASPDVSTVYAGTDCDDDLANVNLEASEVCTTDYDDNCDGLMNDSSSVDAITFYLDSDGDGYGDDDSFQLACEQPTGYVDNNTDCADDDSASNPLAEEIVADGTDQDCDSYEACYVDADGDGDGDASMLLTYSNDLACSSGIEATNALDCDDSSDTTYIGAAHLDTVASITDCTADYDNDGFADAAPSSSLVVAGEDCNDYDSTINPDAVETPANGVDENCNNIELCYLDADSDSYGNIEGTTIASEDTDCLDANEASDTEDCDDVNGSIYPGAPESCNDEDDDCDNEIDEGVDDTAPSDAPMWYGDADGDGYGNSNEDEQFTLVQCDQPSGYVDDSSDCDDLNSATSPDASEVCFDGIDNNCDNNIDAACQKDASEANNVVSGAQINSMAGYDISSADIDGDAVQDLLIAAPGEGDGSVYVLYGPIGLDRDLTSGYDAVFTGTSADNNGAMGLGSSVLLADLNDDELADVLIASPGSSDLGKMYVFYSDSGSARFSGSYDVSSDADATITGTEASVNSICSVNSAGDVNGDAYEDVLLGSCVSNDVSPGYATLLYGQQANLSGAYTLNESGLDDSAATEGVISALFIGDSDGDAFGEHVSSAGDVNGDGLSDIVFGAHMLGIASTTGDEGRAYLLYGDETQLTATYSASSKMPAYSSGSIDEKYGASVGATGGPDINGDGYADFIFGAPESNTNRGFVDIFLGSSSQLAGEQTPQVTIYGESDNDFFGERILGAGDLNDDGYGDILLSAPGDENIGSAHIFYGPLDGTIEIDLSTTGTSSGKLSGQTLSAGLNSNFGQVMVLSDINANGEDDILIASSLNDDSKGQDVGGVFLFTTLLE